MIESKLTSSIAMCTYNGAAYLQKQLDSIRNQTRLPDEMVVCDDGSTDQTLEILEQFAQSVPFSVRVIRNGKNLGCYQNFAHCAEMCVGDLLFLSDQDDIWHLEKIERFTAVFEQNSDVGLIFSDAELIDENDRKRNVLLTESWGIRASSLEKRVLRDYFDVLKKSTSWPGMAMAVRRELIQGRFILEDQIPHDSFLLYFVGGFAKEVFLPQPLSNYRVHQTNVSKPLDKKLFSLKNFVNREEKRSISEGHLQTAQSILYVMDQCQSYADCRYSAAMQEALRQKARHHLMRYRLRTRQISKWYGIFHEFLNGNYFHYGKGFISMGADIFS